MDIKALFRKKSVSQVLANAEKEHLAGGHKLAKHLKVRDLTAFGIAAIIGAGIFSTIGKASFDGGPAVILLFIFTAVACSFAAFAYAEFASLIPVSGSAYTYSYVAFGELFAWVIGWALIMEYAIGNIVVAISWSDYFTSLINNTTPWHISEWMTTDYLSAHKGFEAVSKALANSQTLESLKTNADFGESAVNNYLAWQTAPTIGSFHLVLDVPAIIINFLITALVYRGIKESRNASNIMVLIKLAIVILVIVVGAFYVNTNNWNPFMPNGLSGVLKGISAVFFAYIGFDAISTTAEECENPQRDLPRGIMYAIIICTILYVIIALVLTGMVSYKELNVGDPLAHVFSQFPSLGWLSGIIAVSAVVAMASVMLVFQLGQPRIWMAMSRDGLLPKAFAQIHPKYKTPGFSTVMTGLLVGVPILFVDMTFVTDMCSVGTLFAFVLVCAGVLRLEQDPNGPKGSFKTPYINSKWITPILFLLSLGLIVGYEKTFDVFGFENTTAFLHKTPTYIFFLIFAYMSFLSFMKNLSLIPVLGLLCCLYMMSQIGFTNWVGFSIWLVIGLVIYFGYGARHSHLRNSAPPEV
jgi:amino acid transporter